MNTFETDGKQWLSPLAELWQKLDTQIRQTHRNLEKLVEMKIRIEQELSGNEPKSQTFQNLGKSEPDTATSREEVKLQQSQHFIEVKKEAFRRYFEDALDRVPLEMWATYKESGEGAWPR